MASASTALPDNWTWGAFLIALTIALHVVCVSFLVTALHTIRRRLESAHGRHIPGVVAIAVAAVIMMGLLLAILHGIEALIWAVAYMWIGAIPSPGAAILYSIDSMATRGGSDLVVNSPWRLMGAMEAADGMLLFGISTAFIFTVMQFYYQHLVFLEQPAVSSDPDEAQTPGD